MSDTRPPPPVGGPSPEPPAPGDAPPASPPVHEVGHVLAVLREQVAHLERIVGPEAHAVRRIGEGTAHNPGWMRAAPGEERWPVAVTIAVAVALQFVLPSYLAIGPRWLFPALEAAIAVALAAANPRRIDRRSQALRAGSIALIAVTSVANAWSTYRLVSGLLGGTLGKTAGPLLATGASIYLTNIIVFALWFWEWDRGGPVARANADRLYPDFLFPQMTQDHLAPEDWRPEFFDYLYVSYTNATAFSPTDTMPLAQWAKLLMLAQSAIALTTVALVIARSVNILP